MGDAEEAGKWDWVEDGGAEQACGFGCPSGFGAKGGEAWKSRTWRGVAEVGYSHDFVKARGQGCVHQIPSGLFENVYIIHYSFG